MDGVDCDIPRSTSFSASSQSRMAIVIVRSSPYSSIHRRSFESAKEVPIIDIGLPPPCPDEGEASALGPIPPYNCQSHNEAGAHLAYIAQPHSLPSNGRKWSPINRAKRVIRFQWLWPAWGSHLLYLHAHGFPSLQGFDPPPKYVLIRRYYFDTYLGPKMIRSIYMRSAR